MQEEEEEEIDISKLSPQQGLDYLELTMQNSMSRQLHNAIETARIRAALGGGWRPDFMPEILKSSRSGIGHCERLANQYRLMRELTLSEPSMHRILPTIDDLIQACLDNKAQAEMLTAELSAILEPAEKQ